MILNNNINCTVHAGEAYGPPSIAQALHYCGAHRIGHGVRLREDGDLLNYVNDHRIPLEAYHRLPCTELTDELFREGQLPVNSVLTMGWQNREGTCYWKF